MRTTAACLLAFLLVVPGWAAVHVKETGKERRPFAWQTTRLSADLVRMSAGSLKGGGAEGIVIGALGFVFTIPMVLLSPPVDLIAAPFRRRHFVKWEIHSRILDELGGALGETPVTALAVGWRVTVEDRKAYEVFRSTAAGRTDEDGRFSLSGTGFFGSNKEILVRVSAGSPPLPISTLRLKRKGGKIRAESADDTISGRYRLDPPFPSEAWDD